MEALTTGVYNRVKRYWRRRPYQRLRTTTFHTSKPTPRRRFWRLRISPRLRLRLKLRGSPKKLFLGFRDAYVRMMMKLANSSVVRSRTCGGGYGGEGITRFGMRKYDENMIIDIYKALAMRQAGRLGPGAMAMPAPQIPSHIACSG